jgi:meso-butanediol dehydrogenase / (S,S)-butanediol dehydrogenase / diacetyl reductase
MSKTIVITGAGDGLGRALSRRFASDGETVILLGRTLAKLQAVADTMSGPNLAIECDVANPDSVRAAFATIAEHHQRIDVLINNAAIFVPFDLGDVRDDQIFDQLNINLAGPIFCAREALPLLRGGGHIINVSSESVTIKMPMLWLYAGTKAALERMSAQWSHDLMSDGVRVTVVQAGKMYDETKTESPWDPDILMRFTAETAKAGIDLHTSPRSHYRSVTDTFRAVIDTPADLHLSTVALRGHHAFPKVDQ